MNPDLNQDWHAPLMVMLELQDEMNTRVNHDWRLQRRAWWRAIWVECAELMDHYGGWKWWKHTERDTAQALLEIVDIWHFGLSIELERHTDARQAAQTIASALDAAEAFEDVHQAVEHVARIALAEQRMAFAAVPWLLGSVEADFQTLYRQYVGKNLLNLFRQDHGYREGSYVKVWQGREDNVHLAEIMALPEVAALADPRQAIREALAHRYESHGTA